MNTVQNLDESVPQRYLFKRSNLGESCPSSKQRVELSLFISIENGDFATLCYSPIYLNTEINAQHTNVFSFLLRIFKHVDACKDLECRSQFNVHGTHEVVLL